MKITSQHFTQCAVCQHYKRVRRLPQGLNVVTVCELCVTMRTPQEVMDAAARVLIERNPRIGRDMSIPILFHIMNGPERPIAERN